MGISKMKQEGCVAQELILVCVCVCSVAFGSTLYALVRDAALSLTSLSLWFPAQETFGV